MYSDQYDEYGNPLDQPYATWRNAPEGNGYPNAPGYVDPNTAPSQPPALTPQGPGWTSQSQPNVAATIGSGQPAANLPINPNPANPSTAATGGYTGAKDFQSLVNYWRTNHPATAPDLPGLITFLKQHGVQATQATHANGTLPSDERIIVNGQTFKLGHSLGGGDGFWFTDLNPEGAGGGAPIDTSSLLGGGSAIAPFTEPMPAWKTPTPFTPPTLADMEAEPGYQSRFSEGLRGVNQLASARGLLRTGGTLKNLVRYGQDFASNEYDKTYGRARDTYDLNVLQPNDLQYNRGTADWINRRDTYWKNQANAFDRPYSVARLGYDATAA